MAEASCKDYGGHLVSVHSPKENKFVFDLTVGSNDVWMGGSFLVEADWQWSDRTPFGYTNWWHGEPDNGGKENCVKLVKLREGDIISREWSDHPCNQENMFVCKIMFAKISFPKNGIRQ